MAAVVDRHDPANYPDMDPEVLTIARALGRVLETIEATYDRLQVPLPTRRYWLTGQPAFDCAQVTVALLGTTLGAINDPSNGPVVCFNGTPRTMSLEISIVREAAAQPSSGKAPAAASIQRHATWQTIDTHVLLEALPAIDKTEDGAPGLGVTGQIATPNSEGGFTATVMTVSLSLT